MGSPFKMAPKTPFMKALVGKQGNLPQHLQDAIKAAPAKSTKKPSVEDDVVIDTKTKEVKRKTGGKDIITTEISERGGKGLGTTMGDRQGVGRIQTKTYRKMKGTGKKGSKGAATGTKISGASGMRTLADGTKVVKEATVNTIKPRGVDLGDKKSKGKSPAKMKGVAGLKKKSKATKTTSSKGMPKAPSAKMQAAIKRAGKKGSPVKSTGGKKKLGTEGMTTKQKLEYYKKQKAAGTAKNPKVRMGMGSSYKTIKK